MAAGSPLILRLIDVAKQAYVLKNEQRYDTRLLLQSFNSCRNILHITELLRRRQLTFQCPSHQICGSNVQAADKYFSLVCGFLQVHRTRLTVINMLRRLGAIRRYVTRTCDALSLLLFDAEANCCRVSAHQTTDVTMASRPSSADDDDCSLHQMRTLAPMHS